MKRKYMSVLLTAAGAAAFLAGLILMTTAAWGSATALPYVLVGLGCGAFGHGLGDLISRRAAQKNPKQHKQMEIEKNDERSVAIERCAKAKAYDAMLYAFGAVMIAFALMAAETAVILLLAAAYLAVVGVYVFYLGKYRREM